MISTPQIVVKKCIAKPAAFESPPHAPYKAARPVALIPMGSPVGRFGSFGRVERVERDESVLRQDDIPPQAAHDTDHVSKKLKFDEDRLAHAPDSMVFTIEDLF